VSIGRDGASVPHVIETADGNRTIFLRPITPLTANAVYTLRVNGVADLAGNLLAAPAEATFTTGPSVDLTAPVLTLAEPRSPTLAPTTAIMTIGFGEPINALTLTADSYRLYDHHAARFVEGTRTLSTDGRTLTFRPERPLSANGSYAHYISYYAFLEDLAGNRAAQSIQAFGVASDPSSGGPAVLSYSPGNGQLGAPLNTRVVVNLDQPASLASVTAAAVSVTVNGTPVAGAVVASNDDRTVTWTPSASLASSSTVTVVVSGLRDLAGGVMAPVSWTFTTATAVDSTRPSLSVLNPATNATGVNRSAAIVLTLTEPIAAATVSSATVLVTVDGVSGQVGGSYAVNGATITFTPDGLYPANARVRVALTASVLDFAGNQAIATTTGGFITENVPDTTPPTLVATSPTNGASDVGRHSPVVLTFSEALHPGTTTSTNVTLLVDGVRLGPSVSRSADNRTLTLTGSWPAASTIAVVASSGVTDLAGNALVDVITTFTTTTDDDNTRPSVMSQRPASGATGIARDRAIALFVSEALQPATVPGALYVTENGAVKAGETIVSGNDRVIEFLPDTPWAAGALVQVFLQPTASDGNGNFVNAHEALFHVVADSAATLPTVTRFQPVYGTSSVSTGTWLEIEFSEPLDPATVPATPVDLANYYGGAVTVQATLEGGGRVLRMVPTTPLEPSTAYYFLSLSGLGPVSDLQGSAVAIQPWYFTTGESPDTVAPSVAAVSPPQGATGVGINAVIRIRFTKPIGTLSANAESIRLRAGATVVPFGDIRFEQDDREILVVPQRALAPNVAHTLTIDGVRDPSANAIAPVTVTFTTGSEPDTVAPIVVRVDPANGTAGIGLNPVIRVETSEPIDAARVGQSRAAGSPNYGLWDNVAGRYVAATTSADPGQRAFTLVPTETLLPSHSYLVYFGFYLYAPLFDYAGNQLAAGSYHAALTTGATADTTAPEVLSISPAPSAAQVPRNMSVTVAFSEAVSSASADTVELLANGTPVSVVRTLSRGNQMLTLTPQAPLAASTPYSIRVGPVRDLSGNAVVAVSDLSFTTGTATDLTAPALTLVTPANGGTGVPLNAPITIRLSEPVQAASVIYDGFRLFDSTTATFVAGEVSADTEQTDYTFTPAAPLEANHRYYFYVSWAASILDLGGNTMPGSTSFSFLTSPQ
jgi:hypothetical protein